MWEYVLPLRGTSLIQVTESPSMRRFFAGAAMAATVALSAGCGISQQQEVELGAQQAQQINAQLPIVQDVAVNRYLNILGDSLAKLTQRGDLDWHFYMVNSNEFNAFALPGGYIYINRGVAERSTTMNEFASVVAHEIGHVVLRHSVKQMEQMQGANIGVTVACVLTSVCNSGLGQAAINVAGGAVFAKFSRDDEREADAIGIDEMVRAGINPQGMASMFQKLLEERQRSAGRDGLVVRVAPARGRADSERAGQGREHQSGDHSDVDDEYDGVQRFQGSEFGVCPHRRWRRDSSSGDRRKGLGEG